MPKVTVLMAVYNGECYLREAIDCFLHQTFRDFEFLIINDGSTDHSREIILSYDDPRIRLVDNEYNLGLAKSLNKGLELAAGQYIARQDADDISDPERLEKQVAFLDSNPMVALTGTLYETIDAHGKLIERIAMPCGFTDIRWCLLFFNPFSHSAVMFRKSVVLERIGFYNEALRYSEDYELWSRIVRRLEVANLNEYLAKVRVSPESMTATYGDKAKIGRRIRIINISSLLGWEQANIASHEARFDEMFSLLFGPLPIINLEEINGLIDDILRLQQMFCRHYDIEPTEGSDHRARLCRHISWRLLELSHHYSNQGNFTGAWWLLIKSSCIHRSILLEKQYRLQCLRLITRSGRSKIAKCFS